MNVHSRGAYVTTQAGLSFEATTRTHVGRVRQLNEDGLLDRTPVGLWAVADGMGGHEAGEVASRLIVDALGQVEGFSSGYTFLDEVRDALQRTNAALITRASAMAPGAVIGSTVVALLAYAGHFACLWAGDSRLYRLRGDQLELLTHDHSMVQELIDAGSLSPAEARTFRRSNVITRAVGVSESLALDMAQGEIEAGDLFLLCTDGLTGMLEEAEIAALLRDPSLERAADRLIDATLERGAKDNVTVVLVRAGANPDETVRQAPFDEAWEAPR